MKRSLIALLITGIVVVSAGCSNKAGNDKGNNNNSNSVEQSTNDAKFEDESEEEEEDALGKEAENNDDSYNSKNKNLFESNYNSVKNILENDKMTVTEEEDETSKVNYLYAENGIGDTLSYKLNSDEAIEINYSVGINNILNVDRYKITGTALDEIMTIMVPGLEYTTEVENAILSYVDEGVKSTEINKDNVVIIVTGSYDKVDINVVIK